MAIIVEERETHRKYILVGTGYAAYMGGSPTTLADGSPGKEKSGELPMVAVCTAEGEIGWFYSEQIRVVTIDGKAPSALL
jgi:hypothetical protein